MVSSPILNPGRRRAAPVAVLEPITVVMVTVPHLHHPHQP